MTYTISDRTEYLELEDSLELEGGDVLRGARVAYRTWGKPSDTAILVCHALTGSADADVWWGGTMGTGRLFDPDLEFIVSANVLGGCYGTTGPGSIDADGRRYGPDFPRITITDMVRAQRLLLDHLGVTRLALVIGGSMGGMQALAWAARYPDLVEAVVPIGTGSAQSPWAIALSEAQRAAIVSDPRFEGGRYDTERQPEAGLATARMIAMCSYRSPGEFDARFGRQRKAGAYAAQSYLRHQGRKLVGRFDANTYLTLIRAMDDFEVDPGEVSAPVLAVGISSDVLYPAAEVKALADALPRGEYGELRAPQGHDAFLIETEALTALIRPFRERVANRTPASIYARTARSTVVSPRLHAREVVHGR
jgi:homoserine O-acetyltransferase